MVYYLQPALALTAHIVHDWHKELYVTDKIESKEHEQVVNWKL